MRNAVATAVLLSTLSLVPPHATGAAHQDLPTVASRARRCERIARRLAAGERRSLARPGCGVAEGCTPHQQRRWARLAAGYADDCGLLAALLAFDPMFHQIEYTHPPLAQHLDEEGIRQIELDVYANPAGRPVCAPC
jgi:hypothetical protein